MTEWATCEEWCAGECDGDPKWCRQLRAEAEAKLAAAIKDRDRDWHINDGKIAELEAEVKRLKAQVHLNVCGYNNRRNHCDVCDRMPIRDFERQDDDGRDSGE